MRINPVGAVLLVAVAHMVTTVGVSFDNFMRMELSGSASVSRASHVVDQVLAFPLLRAFPPDTFMSRPGGGGMLFAALALDGVLWGGALVGGWILVARTMRPARQGLG